MNNPYERSKILETFEHHGETFHVVRQKFEGGKPWRGYTALITDDRFCISTTTGANVLLDAATCKERMELRWPNDAKQWPKPSTKAAFLESIERLRDAARRKLESPV